MDLTLQKPGDHLFIRSITDEGIRVVDELYNSPIILTANELIADFAVSSIEDITQEKLERVLQLKPEVVLIGTGAKQTFLPPQLLMSFYSKNVGVEMMTTDAACRTFNVLVSESRNVAAILLPV